MFYQEAREVLGSHGIDVGVINAMTYAEIEGAIARAEDEFEVNCYQTYLSGMWNDGHFESEEDEGYCRNLISYCGQRCQEIRYSSSLL